jgi:hypothetical protein
MAKSEKSKIPRLKRIYYKGSQKSTSIFFLLWSLFTALSLFIVLLFGFTQHYMLERTYKDEAARDIMQKGKEIERLVKEDMPPAFGANFSGYLRFLSDRYGVDIYILNGDGRLLFPIEHQFDPDDAQIENYLNFMYNV